MHNHQASFLSQIMKRGPLISHHNDDILWCRARWYCK